MNLYKYTTFVIKCSLLFSINLVSANTVHRSEFFASNNTEEIDLQTAYNRLISNEQIALKNMMKKVLRKHHIKQGKFESLLGVYRMASNKNVTADNTERFVTSSKEYLSDEKILSLAKEMAVALNQESVAVFIPVESTLGEITVSFRSHLPSINELITILHNKLPERYYQGFSLHLSHKGGDFINVKVTQVQWLGSKMNLEAIKKTFPLEVIHHRYGKVFLIYQNGRKEQLYQLRSSRFKISHDIKEFQTALV